MRGSPWPERDGELRQLWADGHTTAEIGRLMGVSKNSVIGRTHRLRLPSRPSPIRRGVERAPPKPRPSRAGRVTLAPILREPAVAMRQKVSEMSRRNGGLPAPKVTLALAPVVPVAPVRLGHVRECSWIEGEPAGAQTRYCSAPSVPGKPYCEAHHARCHQPTRMAA